MKKYLVGLCMAFMVLSCGSKTENKAEVSEKVFNISGHLVGTGDRIEYFWQNGEGLMPYLTYRALLIPDSKFETVKPDLAKEYTVSDDGKVYTFVMKDGLKWSDGESLTAKDVEFSIKSALRVSLINGIFPANLLNIEGAKDYKEGKTEEISGLKIDGNKITITLNNPVGLFLQILAQFYIFPEHSLKGENVLELHNSSFWTNPVTSGMYKVSKISAGNFVELVRNENYEGAKPKIDKIIYSYIDNPVLAMQDGKTYFYKTNKTQEISELESMEGITKNPINILYYRYWIVNLAGIDGKGDSIVANPKVRQAIMYAIDRESLAKNLYPGIAKSNYSGVPEGFTGALKDANKYEYNPEKAKELLKEAGYDGSRKLILTYYYKDQVSNDFMQAVSYQLDQVGIKNEVIQVQTDPTSALFKLRKYDIAYKGFSSFGYESWYGEYASTNTNFKNIYNGDTSFDELSKKLSETSDIEKRTEILLELQKLEQEKLLKLPIYTFKNYLFINENKVIVPKDTEFGNTFYRYDYKFENWDIKN